jgi:hypothetical protein
MLKKIVFAVFMIVVFIGCSNPVATDPSKTATVTVKMGCYYQGFICTDLVNHRFDGIEFCHDTSFVLPKGNEVYLYFIYNPISFMLDRSVNFIVNHDTTFNYSSPLNPN